MLHYPRAMLKRCRRSMSELIVIAGFFLVALAGLILVPAPVQSQPDGQPFLVIRDYDGYQLREKVVVVKAGARRFRKLEDYPKVGDRLKPFSIFYKLKTPESEQAKGLIRIGTMSGTQLGWIEKSYTQDWNTRFVIEPIRPQPDRTFTFVADLKEGKKEIPLDSLPEKGTHRCFGFVMEKPEETADPDNVDYRIFISTGELADIAGNVEVPDEQDIKLEIVFVLESSDFMNKKFQGDDNKTLLMHLQNLVKLFTGQITNDPKLKKAVRLGLVQYWDNVPWRENDKRLELNQSLTGEAKRLAEEQLKTMSPKFPATVTCDLTDDPAKFTQEVARLKATNLYDDWPDDVLAGLNQAIRNVKWSKDSIKHIILLGSAAVHLDPQGVEVSQYRPGSDNSFTRIKDARYIRGYSSTGLSLQTLLDRARPGGGGTSIELSHKFLHAMFMPNEMVQLARSYPQLDSATITRLRAQVAQIIKENDESEIKKLQDQLIKDLLAAFRKGNLTAKQVEDLAIRCFGDLKRAHLIEYQASRAREQYRELSKNRTGGEGIFREVKPSSEDVTRASEELSRKVLGSFRYIKGLRDGDNLAKPRDNPLALPIWRLSEDIKKEFQKKPIAPGAARVRDKLGREVAVRKIMVSLGEMKRLAGLLHDWHLRFRKLGANRKNPGDILKELKESLGKAGLGQLDIDNKMNRAKLEETTLEKLLNDLPMRSPALKVTPKDIESMDDSKFEKFLKRMEEAAQRCQKHLDDPAAWSSLSEGVVAGDDKYGFFLLSTMP